MTLTRRAFTAGVAASAAIPNLATARTTGAAMLDKANALLASLSGAQRDAVLFSFDGRARKAWNFMTGSRPAPGLRMEQINAQQKDLALDLLATGTSRVGLEKSLNIMLQQDILRDEWGKGSADRNKDRFSVQIYGTPSATAPWTWRWEGHHLSLSFTLVGGEVVSTTPSSFSSEPNTVPSGPHRGLVVLKEEELLGRQLFSDLSGGARRAALVWDAPQGNIQSNRGAEQRVADENAGLPLADMTGAQADIAKRLIEVYTQEVLPPALSRTQGRRLAEEDMEAVRFAWGGADLDNAIYYRLTGAAFLIEFATLFNQPQHLHAVFHDTSRNFGAHLL